MEFLLQKRWRCCRRPSVTRLYRKQKHSRGIKCSEKADNAVKTKSAPDEKKYQLMNSMSRKSKIWCLKIVDWQLETLLILLTLQEDQSARFQKIFWADNSWFLYHDNAPSHTALVLRDHFAKNSTHIVPKPPYSPDLAPCDFCLFLKLKRLLRGHRFDTIEETQAESKKALKAIPEIEFNKCFDDWKKRWHKCIISGWDYFQEDESYLNK